MSPAFAGIFYYAGVLCQHSKRNWFVGIRTPWTMSSDQVWRKTHLLGGQLFKIVAVFSLLGTIMPNYAAYFLLIPVLLVTVFIFAYSYYCYVSLSSKGDAPMRL